MRGARHEQKAASERREGRGSARGAFRVRGSYRERARRQGRTGHHCGESIAMREEETPHASPAGLGSPNVVTRRVHGTPLRKRKRALLGELGAGAGAGEDELGCGEGCSSGGLLEGEGKKKKRRWFAERERQRACNSFHKLFQRECSRQGNLGFAKKASSEKFNRMGIQQVFSTYDAVESERWKLSFLKKRSRVVEIVSGTAAKETEREENARPPSPFSLPPRSLAR